MNIEVEIRRLHKIHGVNKSALAREFNVSRNTVKRILRADMVGKSYNRSKNQPMPKLGEYRETLEKWLLTDLNCPKKEKRTATKYHQELQKLNYQGAYNTVQRFVHKWKLKNNVSGSNKAFVPLSFDPGEAYQFDWSEEIVELGGAVCKVMIAHFRLCYSRKSFFIAYPRETQEMLFDAHNKAFKSFGGLTLRGIYDNMKTAVKTVFRGKEREFNYRFLALMDNYLIKPRACSPAAGWEKGQIENQVGNIREWIFTPRLKFDSLEKLNIYLDIECQKIAKERTHPEFKDKTIEDVFLLERPKLRELMPEFDGYKEKTCKVSSTCLVHFDNNRYSADCAYANKMVTVRAYTDKIEVFYDSEQIATHARSFDKNKSSLNPLHYLPLVERKPGALLNGAPFKNWNLPKPILKVKEILMDRKGGDREAADILLSMNEYGMEEVSVACDLALQDKAVSRDNVINILNRLRDTGKCEEIKIPEALILKEEPTSDCTRYNVLIVKNIGASYAIH